MATKAKSSATPNSGPAKGQDDPLNGKLAAAMELFYGQKPKEAAAALHALLPEAEARGVKVEDGPEVPAMQATLLLNRKEGQAALDVLEPALKKDAADPRLNFLKAAALVHLGKADLAAEALGKAIAADPSMQVLFRLEPDFDGVRHGSAFAAFERD
jgi:predicted Zn-dependent protease